MSPVELEEARALNTRLITICADHRRAEYQLATLLVEMAVRRHYRTLGYASLAEYAAAALDLQPRKTLELTKIGRALSGLPLLAAALQAGGLDWTKAREIVRVATAETEEAWVARARELSSRALEKEVAHSERGAAPPDEGAPPPLEPARRILRIELEAADYERVRQAIVYLRAATGMTADTVEDGVLITAMADFFLEHTGKLEARATPIDGDAPETHPEGAPPPEPEPPAEPYRVVIVQCPDCHAVRGLDAEVSDTIVSEARCDAEIIDMREGPRRGHATRAIPPALRRIVLHKAGWRCSVPGCGNRTWLHIHHDRPWAQGGGHDEHNLRVLCSAHHRGVHDGLIALTRLPSGATRVEYADGRKIDGPIPLPHVGAIRPTPPGTRAPGAPPQRAAPAPQ